MLQTAELTHVSKLDHFYNQPVIYIPNNLLGTEGRVYLTGRLNSHPFEAIAEPWRGGQHIMILPAHLLNALWIEQNATIELVFTTSNTARHLIFPERLSTIFKTNPDYERAFLSMTESDQRQYLAWINAAISPQVKEQRVDQTIHHVREELHLGEQFRLNFDKGVV